MKNYFIAFFITALALFSACGDGGGPSSSPSPSSTLMPTAPPDYSNVDFSGRWQVSALISPGGSPAASVPPEGADFVLELAQGGDYFVYDSQGAVLGQGRWAVSGDRLSLTGGGETVYTIVNADTLRASAPDGSVTIMSKLPSEDEEPPDGEETPEQESPDSGESP